MPLNSVRRYLCEIIQKSQKALCKFKFSLSLKCIILTHFKAFFDKFSEFTYFFTEKRLKFKDHSLNFNESSLNFNEVPLISNESSLKFIE